MSAFDNFLTFFILTFLLLIVYLKYTNQKIGDLIQSIKESVSSNRIEGGAT